MTHKDLFSSFPQKKWILCAGNNKCKLSGGVDLAEYTVQAALGEDVFVHPSETIHRFENGGFGIGAALLEFENKKVMLKN